MNDYVPGYWVSDAEEVVFATALVDLLRSAESGLFILEGLPGSGKTHLLHSLARQNDIRIFSCKETTDFVIDSATRCILKKGVLEYELISILATYQHSLLAFEDLDSFADADSSQKLLSAALSKIAEAVTVVVTMNNSQALPHFLSGVSSLIPTAHFRYIAL